MKFQNLFLMAATVGCLSCVLMVNGLWGGTTADSILPLFFLLLIAFPLLKKDTIVAALESDIQFYDRVICKTSNDPNCLACFPAVTRPTCTINQRCAWDELNNICYPAP